MAPTHTCRGAKRSPFVGVELRDGCGVFVKYIEEGASKPSKYEKLVSLTLVKIPIDKIFRGVIASPTHETVVAGYA